MEKLYKNLRWIFFGSSNFSVLLLKKILKFAKPTAIITLPPKPKGRGLKISLNPVADLALKEKIPFKEFQQLDQSAENYLKQISPLFGLIGGFGLIIPKEIIQIFKKGILNIHPSLLPKYRGPAPIQWAILNNEKETGVSLIIITENIDEGKILGQKLLTLKGNEYYQELEEKLAHLGGELFQELLTQWLENKLVPQPQNNKNLFYARKLTKEDGLLNYDNKQQVLRKIRALNPWPGSYFVVKFLKDNQEKILKIFRAEEIPQNTLPKDYHKIKEKEFFSWRNFLALKFKDGALWFEEVQLQDRKRMSSREFLNGYPIGSFRLKI